MTKHYSAGMGRSRLRQMAKSMPGARSVAQLARRLFSPYHREIMRLQRDASDQLFQPYPTTAEERYPRLFDALAERMADRAEPRILSFGCSSGEEVRALRRRLPDARIVGLDLNRRAIAAARAADQTTHSEYRCESAPRPGERFDAILALAVFRHGDLERLQPADCSSILPFCRFEQGLAELDAVLEPGGWLALYNQHFLFADTALAARYTVDSLCSALSAKPRVLYGSDNLRSDSAGEAGMLFRKTRDE